MNRKLWLIVSLLLIVVLLMVGCAKPVPAPAPTPAPAPAPAPTPSPKVTTWRLHTISSEAKIEVQSFYHMADEIKEKSNGQLVIEVFPSAALGFTEEDVLRVMQRDNVELAHSWNSRVAGEEPLATVGDIPFLATSPEDVFKVNKAIVPMWDEILPRWHGKLLSNWSGALCPLTATRKVETVEEWKGLKIRTQSETLSKVIELLAAVPVQMPFTEAYSATATRIVEGHFWAPATLLNQNMHEVCDYMNQWSAMAFGCMLIVNTTAFNKLPKDMQDLVMESAAKWEQWVWDNDYWKADEYFAKLLATGQIEKVEVSIEEKLKAAKMISPVYDDWLSKAGPDGLKWLNVCLTTVGKPPHK